MSWSVDIESFATHCIDADTGGLCVADPSEATCTHFIETARLQEGPPTVRKSVDEAPSVRKSEERAGELLQQLSLLLGSSIRLESYVAQADARRRGASATGEAVKDRGQTAAPLTFEAIWRMADLGIAPSRIAAAAVKVSTTPPRQE